MNTNDMHPVELLLAVALEVAEAVLVLAVALVALLLTAAEWASNVGHVLHLAGVSDVNTLFLLSADATPDDAPPAPLLHPLALVAEQLEALPVTRLRPMAGVTSKRHRKAELVAQLVAC